LEFLFDPYLPVQQKLQLQPQQVEHNLVLYNECLDSPGDTHSTQPDTETAQIGSFIVTHYFLSLLFLPLLRLVRPPAAAGLI
jgi:hypothetical protein